MCIIVPTYGWFGVCSIACQNANVMYIYVCIHTYVYIYIYGYIGYIIYLYIYIYQYSILFRFLRVILGLSRSCLDGFGASFSSVEGCVVRTVG